MKISVCNISREFPEELVKINEILSPFYKKAYTLSTELCLNLEDETDADIFLDKLYETSRKYVDTVVQMAIDYLIKLDIWDYNVDRFNEEYEAERYNINAAFTECYGREYLEILEAEEQIRNVRTVERSSRSEWVGGGFGVGGAIKGAIQAEILNFATDTVRSISDSSEDAADKANISKLKRQLTEDKEKLKSYSYSLRIKLQNIGWSLYDFLVKNNKVEKYPFDMNTAYARFSNIVNSSIPNEEKASKIIDCILTYPYLYDFYGALYDIEPSKTVFDLAAEFGFLKRMQAKFLKDFWNDYQSITKNEKSGTPEQRNKKFLAFVKIMKKHNFMRTDGTWDVGFAEDYQLCDLLEEHKSTYDILEKARRTFNNKRYPTVADAQNKYNEYIEAKRAEKERAENIETIKNIFKIGVPLALVGAVIYGFYYVFSESGMLSALMEMFNSVGN